MDEVRKNESESGVNSMLHCVVREQHYKTLPQFNSHRQYNSLELLPDMIKI